MVVELSVWALYPAGIVPGVTFGVEVVDDILEMVAARKVRVRLGVGLKIIHSYDC
jgi:hypothetical protein